MYELDLTSGKIEMDISLELANLVDPLGKYLDRVVWITEKLTFIRGIPFSQHNDNITRISNIINKFQCIVSTNESYQQRIPSMACRPPSNFTPVQGKFDINSKINVYGQIVDLNDELEKVCAKLSFALDRIIRILEQLTFTRLPAQQHDDNRTRVSQLINRFKLVESTFCSYKSKMNEMEKTRTQRSQSHGSENRKNW